MVTKALIVIDMQNDLCHDLRRSHLVEQMIFPLQQIIEHFVAAKQPVFYVAFCLPPNDPQFERFGDKYCIKGTEGAEIISELQPLRGTVIYKSKHSAFFETDLDKQLKQVGVQSVYLAGLQTQICIMTTAADASFRGYRTIAISDCVISSQEANKRAALDWIAKYVGEVLTVEETLTELKCD